jgi:phosphatidyl-myo-inositol dimannoside synthase
VHVHRRGRSLPAEHPGRDLIFISAGLDLDGGGRAVAGRLLAAACAEFAGERGIGYSLLSLQGLDGYHADPRARGFGGRQRQMALAAWRPQVTGRRVACVYDLLGPARVQAWLPRPLSAPYLVTLYGIEVWRPLSAARSRALRRAAIRLAISRHTRDGALAAQGDVGPIEVLPLCLEERQPAGTADEALLDRVGSGFLLIVGRMAASERYKGHDLLLEALLRLRSQSGGRPAPRPLPAAESLRPRLVIVGDGDDRRRLEQRARELGLAEQALFTGFVSEATLAALYRRAAVFAMPSRGEGFGLVYLEAMRAAKPCLAARDTAAAEIVLDGETGLLVDALDPDELAAALTRLLASPDLAHRLGEAGRRRFEQVFTPTHFRQRLRPLLERLVG